MGPELAKLGGLVQFQLVVQWMGKRNNQKNPKQRELRHRIEGYCFVCGWKFIGRVEKTCEWCYQQKMIHVFLLTILDDDE
jgi:hypothetical protein